MNPRERIEERIRCPVAARLSCEGGEAGACGGEGSAPDGLRARDRDRILHSNSFRRMKHKTQVYIAPQGDPLSDRG